jgi:hypothetical protein
MENPETTRLHSHFQRLRTLAIEIAGISTDPQIKLAAEANGLIDLVAEAEDTYATSLDYVRGMMLADILVDLTEFYRLAAVLSRDLLPKSFTVKHFLKLVPEICVLTKFISDEIASFAELLVQDHDVGPGFQPIKATKQESLTTAQSEEQIEADRRIALAIFDRDASYAASQGYPTQYASDGTVVARTLPSYGLSTATYAAAVTSGVLPSYGLGTATHAATTAAARAATPYAPYASGVGSLHGGSAPYTPYAAGRLTGAGPRAALDALAGGDLVKKGAPQPVSGATAQPTTGTDPHSLMTNDELTAYLRSLDISPYVRSTELPKLELGGGSGSGGAKKTPSLPAYNCDYDAGYEEDLDYNDPDYEYDPDHDYGLDNYNDEHDGGAYGDGFAGDDGGVGDGVGYDEYEPGYADYAETADDRKAKTPNPGAEKENSS